MPNLLLLTSRQPQPVTNAQIAWSHSHRVRLRGTTVLDIVQIVPRVPPLVDGIGDYSLKLAGHLREHHGISTQFLVCQQRKTLSPTLDGFPTIGLPHQEVTSFVQAMPQEVRHVVLHYTNYPYVLGKHDAPFWLMEGLKAARQERDFRLVVMFHELPLLKRTNYIRPIQGFVALRIAKMADRVLTNCANFQSILLRWLNEPIATLPVFSNVSEPGNILPLAERPRRMVVFGGPNRMRIYRDSMQELAQACRSLGITEIYDIGPPLKLDQLDRSDLDGIQITEMGVRSLDEISELMLQAIAGFFDYSRFSGFLAKSGVFAAYCAHGLIPISATYNPSEADGVWAGQNYLIADARLDALPDNKLQAIAQSAHTWYAAHNQQNSANVFAEHLLSDSLHVQQPSFAT